MKTLKKRLLNQKKIKKEIKNYILYFEKKYSSELFLSIMINLSFLNDKQDILKYYLIDQNLKSIYKIHLSTIEIKIKETEKKIKILEEDYRWMV